LYSLTKIGLISDTHSYLHPLVFEHFAEVDEIWHAGDFGLNVAQQLKAFKSLKGVYGNIDDATIRQEFPEQLLFACENVKVLMRHIGGYPPKYNLATKKELQLHRPQLFIAGHSHILKIMYDDALQCLHINPGAAGQQGWHKVKMLVRFCINGSNITNCEVIELS
jgi:uncharacterized protein